MNSARTLYRRIILVVAASTVSYGATSLDVYKDRSIYSYKPSRLYIGISKITKAVCGPETALLVPSSSCPTQDRLCKRYTDIQQLQTQADTIQAQLDTLAAFGASLHLNAVSPTEWIRASRTLAKHTVSLRNKLRKVQTDIRYHTRRLAQATRAKEPIAFASPCNRQAHLTLPADAITFNVRYKAVLHDNYADITQMLEVRNQSGIDINATVARFFTYAAAQRIYPPLFSPQTLSDEPPVAAYPRKQALQAVAADVASKHKKQIRKEARQYTLAPFILPSSGLPKRFVMERYDAPIQCRIELHAYANIHAFRVCRFSPKSTVEYHTWAIDDGKNLVNRSAVGRYEKNEYALYINRIKTLLVRRSRYVPKKKEDGFFDTKIKKRDGRILHLTNTASQPITLYVVERIPVSSTDKITVTLLPIKGVEKPQLTKEGKVTFRVKLGANESKEIPILYDIVHDKTTKVYRR